MTTTAQAPQPSVTTPDGWVTFQRVHVPGIGLVLVQKRDGCTRSVTTGRR